ncbi:MAG: bifunctional fucokinase/L-fucose-1-P-guanylyltransferase [Marinilabiliaceae bacterium]|nr:bifunctional fucokinase/L-fucose-1-P-guanylyltransferase [Marinilabiliaceae bacterium]
MQKLLTLPENLVSVFYEIENVDKNDWFVCSDPVNKKVGSGGGTANLLFENWKNNFSDLSFSEYLKAQKKIIIHAGGQSRRLPAYAPSGKVLSPIPVFRWSKGQKIDQNLLSLQIPLYERILESTSDNLNCLVASGDVLIITPKIPAKLPEADVVCFGLWVEPQLASRHGVFFTPRTNPHQLNFMLQKPSINDIEQHAIANLYLMDIGIWCLSDKAVKVLMNKSGWDDKTPGDFTPSFYDLYSSFGECMGTVPASNDQQVNDLSVAIIPLDGGEFYHYGTSAELISSTEKIQNRIKDQREILHKRVKTHPSLFVQNAITDIDWSIKNHNIWIENCIIGSGWRLNSRHIITGVPDNNWEIELPESICLDVVPIGENDICIRPYGINDLFNGDPKNEKTVWMGIAFTKWCETHNIDFNQVFNNQINDIQCLDLFPLIKAEELNVEQIKWLIGVGNADLSGWYKSSKRLSAEQISAQANLMRLNNQRALFRKDNLKLLYQNHQRSIFYQSDLKNMALLFAQNKIEPSKSNGILENDLTRIKDCMFRSELNKINGDEYISLEHDAFTYLKQLIIDDIDIKHTPKLNVFPDQIVWARSPVRLDLAGGWSDTPPYCIENGGQVLNIAVNLNGQPPLQAFIRLSKQPIIVIRSIDNGVSEIINSYNDLQNYNAVGSPFSIPKAALCLAGFYPDFCESSYGSLEDQLRDFGGGLEISLLAAVPKGSGLGTSSILAATLLGALSDFCQLGWDKSSICHRTLVLEQLLTTGGGWQDQYGGIFGGIKLLESGSGLQDNISVKWLSDQLFTGENSGHWLLYYTGVTRVAKNILSEIVRGMFLNESTRLNILNQIKTHAMHTYEAIQKNDYILACSMINKSWILNKQLDSGTTTPEIESIITLVEKYTYGYKLLGAGGGGYMLIGAKDVESAKKIKTILSENVPNKNARFVDLSINVNGLQITRS